LFCWWDCRLECEIEQAVIIIVDGNCLFGLACNIEDVDLLLWLNFRLWLLLKFFKNIFGFGCLDWLLFFFLDMPHFFLLFFFLNIAGKFSEVEGLRLSIFLQILEPAVGLLHILFTMQMSSLMASANSIIFSLGFSLMVLSGIDRYLVMRFSQALISSIISSNSSLPLTP